jgi:pilus assembly protein CpaF
MVAPGLVAVLASLVAQRTSCLITGATGTGKSTLLASLLSLVPDDERIVIIEEAGELAPTHPHVVRLVERRANVDGAGGVALRALVREALRMRPDRVVLGECRGAEIAEVLAAFNTGHRGGFTTLHADAAADVPARLTALGALAGLSERAVALHAGAAFDVVIHVRRTARGRAVAEVATLACEHDRLVVTPALSLIDGEVKQCAGWSHLGIAWPEGPTGMAA